MASGCFCLCHFWDGAEEILPAENIFSTEDEFRRKITAYAALSKLEKKKQQTFMRELAYEMFNIERTKTEIHRILGKVVA